MPLRMTGEETRNRPTLRLGQFCCLAQGTIRIQTCSLLTKVSASSASALRRPRRNFITYRLFKINASQQKQTVHNKKNPSYNACLVRHPARMKYTYSGFRLPAQVCYNVKQSKYMKTCLIKFHTCSYFSVFVCVLEKMQDIDISMNNE